MFGITMLAYLHILLHILIVVIFEKMVTSLISAKSYNYKAKENIQQ